MSRICIEQLCIQCMVAIPLFVICSLLNGDYLSILMYLTPCKANYFWVYKRMISQKVLFTI